MIQEYNKNGRCKICRSDLCEQIDTHLKNGKSYKIISDWANKIEPDLKLTKNNVWTHNKKHRCVYQETESNTRKGRKKGLKNEKPIPIKKTTKKTIKKTITKIKKNNETTEKKTKKIKTKKTTNQKNINKNIDNDKTNINMEKTTEFLDMIISQVKKRIEDKAIKPTITEGIKATELKIKIQKNNPFEDTLLTFLEEISQ